MYASPRLSYGFDASGYDALAVFAIGPAVSLRHDDLAVSNQCDGRSGGGEFFEQGRDEGALNAYRRALQINPHHAEAHNNVGSMLAKRGEIAAAAIHFREALRLQPNYAQAHNNLGSVAAQLGEYDKARIHFLDALKIDPNYTSANRNLARVLAILKNVSQAMPQSQQHLAVGPAPRAPGNSGKRNSQNEPTSPGRRP